MNSNVDAAENIQRQAQREEREDEGVKKRDLARIKNKDDNSPFNKINGVLAREKMYANDLRKKDNGIKEKS